MEEVMAANAAVEETAAPEAEPAVEATTDDGAAAVETPQTEEDITKTQAFSRRLNEMSSKAVDDFVAGLGWENDITGERITSRKEYERYQKMKSAEAEGRDPVTAAENADLWEQLSHFRDKEQDAALAADPDSGEAYQMVRDDVLKLVEYSRANGHPEVDVDSAFKVVLQRNAGRILKEVKTRASSQAIKQTSAAAKASPGKLSGGDVPQSMDWNAMSDKEFDKYLKMAKRGALKQK